MRKIKKINGYLIVKFNDRELREWDGTCLVAYGVIDAELYTGCLGVDRSVMEYDSAETQLEAEEQARGLEAEYSIIERLPTCTVVKETDDTTEERVVEPAFEIADFEALLRTRIASHEYPEVTPTTAHHQLYGFKAALYRLGLIEAEDCVISSARFQTDDETPQQAADQPPATAFRHLPETVNPGNNEKVFWLGLQLEQDCPKNDCMLYRNIFRMCRELDDQIDRLTGWPRTRLDAELRKQYFDLETMYLTNHAVRQYRRQQREAAQDREARGDFAVVPKRNLTADEIRELIQSTLCGDHKGSIVLDDSPHETENTPDEQMPCPECELLSVWGVQPRGIQIAGTWYNNENLRQHIGEKVRVWIDGQRILAYSATGMALGELTPSADNEYFAESQYKPLGQKPK